MSEELSEQERLRREKLARLREQGNPYPNDFRRDALAADLLAKHADASAEDLEGVDIKVAVAGRMMTRRIMGKASFAHIQDVSGPIQLYVRRDDLLDGVYSEFKKWGYR